MKPSSRTLEFLLIAACGCVGPAFAQETVRWEVPRETLTIDFASDKPAPTKALSPAGLAWEIPVGFAMLRETVTLVCKLPEAGDVELVLQTKDALVDITPNRNIPGEVKIELKSRLGRMDVESLRRRVREEIEALLAEPRKQAAEEAQQGKPADLRKYLRDQGSPPPREEQALPDAYVERRTLDLGRDLLEAALEKLAADRPRWVLPDEQAAWSKATDDGLHKEYQRLLALDLAEKHLRRCGIRLDTSKRNFGVLIESKFRGLHALVSGSSASGDPASLTPQERADLRDALEIQAVCRFVPATDERDGNAHWFNGQRLGSSIRGVPMIRVVGALDPAHGDLSDWWRLVGFDEQRLQLRFPDQTGFRHELYQDPQKQTCLRIVATGKQGVAYTFEISSRTASSEGQAVVVHESPDQNHAKFPF